MSKTKVNLGRPSKYNEEIQAKADEYVNNFRKFGDVVPTIASLALHLDVTYKTIYNWATEENPNFLHTYNRLMMLQHKSLVNGGLAGGFNPAVTKMMMTQHGYSDKQEIDHTTNGKDIQPTRIELVAPTLDK